MSTNERSEVGAIFQKDDENNGACPGVRVYVQISAAHGTYPRPEICKEAPRRKGLLLGH